MVTIEDAYLEALLRVSRQPIPECCQRDILGAIRAINPGPLPFLVSAAEDAALPRTEVLRRIMPIFFFSCAGNLADDLSDGDCDYFDGGARLGPSTQMILQNLFFESLMTSGIDATSRSEAVLTLTAAVALQHVEIRTSKWTAALFRQVAEGIAGKQWAAYLEILWSGTPLAEKAQKIGRAAAIVGHITVDIESQDVRVTTLSTPERREILMWAADLTRELREQNLDCLQSLLAWSEPILLQANS